MLCFEINDIIIIKIDCTTKLIIENFDQHSNFTTLNSYFMNIQSLGVDDINTDMTLQNIDPKVSTSVNNEITYNNQSITYRRTDSKYSD